MWARVAGELRGAHKEREAARELSNTRSGSLTEWQRWLLDHLTNEIDQPRAIDLAVMWARVAAVQPIDDDGPLTPAGASSAARRGGGADA